MTGCDEVGRLLDVITVDCCYHLAEQMIAFYETSAEAVPLHTTVVGTITRALGIDMAEHGEDLTAHCHRGDVVQNLRPSDMVFPPDTAAAWIGPTRPTAAASA